jgi:endonuclease YncB( thermonuclease family)
MKTSASFSRAFLRSWLVAIALLLAVAGNAAETKRKEPAKWVTLNGCRFMPEEHSDGDSFHAKHGSREFIFRLYFVDAPETDANLRDRIREQSRHFQTTPAEVLKAGEAAKKFTAEWLRRPFTATTRWQIAMGRSRLPRYYALIEADGQDLAELLVSRGLARAKGTVAILPDGTPAKQHMAKLRKVEAEAKAKRVGIWAHSNSVGK